MQKLDMLANIYGFWKLQLPRTVFHMMGNQSQVKILAKFPNISGFLKAVEDGRQSSGTEHTEDQTSHIPRVTANRCGPRANPGVDDQTMQLSPEAIPVREHPPFCYHISYFFKVTVYINLYWDLSSLLVSLMKLMGMVLWLQPIFSLLHPPGLLPGFPSHIHRFLSSLS